MNNEAFITRRGGGGSGLDLRIVGGTTQPTNPKGNTIWVKTATPIKSYAVQAEKPARKSNNKNLIVYPFCHTTQTGEGITWTDNGDGTVKANGTAVGGPLFRLSAFDGNDYYMYLEPGTYTLSGCPAGGSADTYLMELFILNPNTQENEPVAIDYGEGATFSLAFACKARINLNVINGATVNGIVFKPQLEKGNAATAFVKGDATGQVWVETGANSDAPLDVDKKNDVLVYPSKVYQHAGGEWEAKDAEVFIKGQSESVELIYRTFLYKDGDEYTSITGGWSNSGYTISSYSITTPTKNDASVTIASTTKANAGCCGTANAIDLTGFSFVEFILSAVTNGPVWLIVNSTKAVYNSGMSAALSVTAPGTFEVPVDALNGSYFIAVAVFGSTATPSKAATFASVRLKRGKP